MMWNKHRRALFTAFLERVNCFQTWNMSGFVTQRGSGANTWAQRDRETDWMLLVVGWYSPQPSSLSEMDDNLSKMSYFKETGLLMFWFWPQRFHQRTSSIMMTEEPRRQVRKEVLVPFKAGSRSKTTSQSSVQPNIWTWTEDGPSGDLRRYGCPPGLTGWTERRLVREAVRRSAEVEELVRQRLFCEMWRLSNNIKEKVLFSES